jgi:hypothetical protein
MGRNVVGFGSKRLAPLARNDYLEPSKARNVGSKRQSSKRQSSKRLPPPPLNNNNGGEE